MPCVDVFNPLAGRPIWVAKIGFAEDEIRGYSWESRSAALVELVAACRGVWDALSVHARSNWLDAASWGRMKNAAAVLKAAK